MEKQNVLSYETKYYMILLIMFSKEDYWTELSHIVASRCTHSFLSFYFTNYVNYSGVSAL